MTTNQAGQGKQEPMGPPNPRTVVSHMRAKRLREVSGLLADALHAALMSYHPSYKHSGIGRCEPELIPPPAWVEQARSALRAARGE